MSHVTCDSSFDELIDAAFKAVKKEKMVSIRMIGDKRPYNFPLPIVRVKPEVKNTDTVPTWRSNTSNGRAHRRPRRRLPRSQHCTLAEAGKPFPTMTLKRTKTI